MKVVHLISGDLWAGAEIATYHLIRAQSEQLGEPVHCALLNEGELAARLREAGIPIAIYPESQMGLLALARRLRQEFRIYDLVHAHRDKESLLAALSGRPWVVTQHGRPEPFYGFSRTKRRLAEWLDLQLKRFSSRGVIAVSEEVATWLQTRIGTTPLFQLANGIADPATGVDLIPYQERPSRIGVLGRLAPVKNFSLAIKALAHTSNVTLEVVGDGPENSRLKKLASDLGLDQRIAFVGHDAHPLARLAGWRCLLITSEHEGHPINMLEAMGLGTPLLVAPIAGLKAPIDAGAGWMVSSRDPEEWGAQIARVMKQETASAQASHNARRYFEANLQVASVATQSLKIYRELLPLGSQKKLDR